MNKQNAIALATAVIIGIAIIAGVVIYTQSTRYESRPAGGESAAIYVIDKQTGKTKVVRGGVELTAKTKEDIDFQNLMSEIRMDEIKKETAVKPKEDLLTKEADKIRKEHGYKPSN